MFQSVILSHLIGEFVLRNPIILIKKIVFFIPKFQFNNQMALNHILVISKKLNAFIVINSLDLNAGSSV